jgi:hypothetical protein
VLLLNDWVLKPAVGNWLTGKLSDAAGLVAFALFWTALLPTRRTWVFAVTAVSFALWKSPATDAPLAAWNALVPWPLSRVVDYTDWFALAALVPAYRLARRDAAARRAPSRLARRVAAVGTGAAAMMAFMATSVAPPHYGIPDDGGYGVRATRSEVRAGLQALALDVADRSSRPAATRSDRTADTLQVYIRQPPERDIAVSIDVSDVAPGESRIRLLDVTAWGPEPRSDSVRRAFYQQVVEPLRRRFAPRAPEH